MSWLFNSFFLTLIMLFPGFSYGADLPLEDLISRIQTSYESLTDLRASFEQETMIQDFKTPIKYKGEIFLKKKDKMKLVYLQPKKEDIYIQGNQMMTYLPDQHQAVSGIFSKEQESQLPLRLLSGEAIIRNEFNIKKESGKNSNAYHLLLVPQQKDENLEKIEVEIDPSTYLIKTLRLFQINQNFSSFTFSNIHINSGLKDQIFNFIAPEGTEILRPPVSFK